MKKLILLSLLLPLWSISSAAVQVKSLSTDYANKRVTFALSWAAGTRNATHLSKVWVLVDYQEVTNPNTTGVWQRATVVSATATTGTVSGNTGRGFFVQGTDGAFSSTVTVTLSSVPAKFNWCATATDYPPNAVMSNGIYTLKGTTPFTINGSTTVSARTYTGACITSFTDATGCPGIVDQLPGGASIAVTSTACQNVRLSATGTNTTSWVWSNVNASSGAAATVTAVGTRTVYATPVNSCGSGTQVSRSVTVATCCGARDANVGTGGCCQSGLTLVGGGTYTNVIGSYTTTAVCRDLAADNASTFTGCGFEIESSDRQAAENVNPCPATWRRATYTELQCLSDNNGSVGGFGTYATRRWYWTWTPTWVGTIPRGGWLPYNGHSNCDYNANTWANCGARYCMEPLSCSTPIYVRCVR